MNLAEPHCGTDLGLIRTRAAPNADGSYAITGTKIFISAGAHDLTDNIIHLVLATTPDAPESSKGISLFIVPKFLVNDDGSPGERNAVTCGSIAEKLGIHGNATRSEEQRSGKKCVSTCRSRGSPSHTKKKKKLNNKNYKN